MNLLVVSLLTIADKCLTYFNQARCLGYHEQSAEGATQRLSRYISHSILHDCFNFKILILILFANNRNDLHAGFEYKA